MLGLGVDDSQWSALATFIAKSLYEDEVQKSMEGLRQCPEYYATRNVLGPHGEPIFIAEFKNEI